MWERTYGPDPLYSVCGDEALFEVGSVYENGPLGLEVVYYVIQQESDGRFGVEEMDHSWTGMDREAPTGEEYAYESGWDFSFETFEEARDRACRLAEADESWKLKHWQPEEMM